MTPAQLEGLDDNGFLRAWSGFSLEERAALPDDTQGRCRARFVHLTPHVEASVARAERSQLEAERAAPARAPLPRVWVDDAQIPEAGPSLVKGIIGRGDFGVIYGGPSTGKTFLTIDMACHVALGEPWRGRKTSAALAVYVAAEAGRSILTRFVAARERLVPEGREMRVPLAIITRPVNLALPAEVDGLVVELRAIAEECSDAQGVGLVVFDTLSRSMPGADENASSDLTRVIAAIDLIRGELGASVVAVHHSGKDASKGARGHSALVAAADFVIGVADHVATIEKVRDAVAGQAIPFALEVVQLGEDRDGDPITTCIAIEAEAGDEPMPQHRPLGPNEKIAIDTLRKLFATTRKNLAERGDDPASACITLGSWREALEAKKINRGRYHEVRASLLKRGVLRIDGVHVELVEGRQ
ncbi:MAG TPA: AAA family ATPase [Usitatibacter sp.]|jgi:hypothetical protein|nr:AAA family ATPase [Usitatibacter sp.]